VAVINHVDAKKAIEKLGLLQGVDAFGVAAVSRSRRIEKEISKPSTENQSMFFSCFLGYLSLSYPGLPE
jgi:hypothetical protein